MRAKSKEEIERWYQISKETRNNTDKFYWYWSTFSGGTLVLLFNFINNIESIDLISKTALRFCSWFILLSFILGPLRNFLNNYITVNLNLIDTSQDKDDGRTLKGRANKLSFFRNIFGLLSIVLYIFGLLLVTMVVNILFLYS